ncbi:hypothetical protein PSP6_630056 [Paraburkholderia tropica]|nr:hypothetical protein PSP6_630056 [Paraburkholderia tropica]
MRAVLSGFAVLVADLAALTAVPLVTLTPLVPLATLAPPRLRFRTHGHIARMPGRARRQRVRGDH